MGPPRQPPTRPGTVRSNIMRNRYRTAVLAACGAFAVTQVAAGVVCAERPASAEEVTISVSNLPPSTEEETARPSSSASRSSRRSIRTSPSNQTSSSTTSPRSRPNSPAARCRPCTRSRSPTSRVCSSAARSPTSPPRSRPLPYAADFNPNVLAVAQDADGAIFGVPVAAYGIGLHYNRALFEEAGSRPRRSAHDVGGSS